MSKAKKTPVRFEFDQSDEAQRTLSAEYPKSRRKINIFRSILVGLLLLIVLFSAFLPLAHGKKEGSDRSYAFSPAEFFVGIGQLGSIQDKFVQDFVENDGTQLLIAEKEHNMNQHGYGFHASSTEAQAKQDVIFKREETKGFGAFMRYTCYSGYFLTIRKNADMISAHADVKTQQDIYDAMTDALEKAVYITDLLPYEIEHMNYCGVLHFLDKALSEISEGTCDAATMETLMQDFLLKEYDAEELIREIEASEGIFKQLFRNSLLPDYQDTFELSGLTNVTFGLGVTDTNFPIFLTMSAFLIIAAIIVLILTTVMGVRLFKMWKDPASDVRPTHTFIHLFYMTIMAFVLSLVSGTIMQAGVSAALVIYALFTVGTIVFEIFSNVQIKKLRNKFLK